jgi:hypothetical protein
MFIFVKTPPPKKKPKSLYISSSFIKVGENKMKKGVKIWALIAVLVITGSVFSGMVGATNTSKNLTNNTTISNERVLDNAPIYNVTTQSTVPSIIKVLMPSGSVIPMNLDEYLKGVVAAEMYPDWSIEALKAQAVASRSFAVANTHHDHVSVDVCTNSGCCQAWIEGPYNENVIEAVTATHNVVMTYNGEIVREALFFAHCNGHTRNSEDYGGWNYVPYLRSVSCNCGFSDYFGHGVGMCQWGAKAMAEQGYGYEDILKHYYTGIEVEAGTPSGDSYEPDDTYSQATLIPTDGTHQTHNFEPAGDHDWVRFTAVSGTEYTIETSNLGSGSDTFIYLYDRDGTTEITHNDDHSGLASRIVWNCPTSGTYYVMIRHYDSSSHGPDTQYDISITTLRTIDFAGYRWNVKHDLSGDGGPGPNYWSDSEENVRVDNEGKLHLKITIRNGIWYCPEVYTQHFTQYGKHRFYVNHQLDELDKNVTVALFLYKDDETEVDIEFSRWGEENPGCNAQYVIQPSGRTDDICIPTENYEPFLMQLSGTHTTHYIDWHSSWIRFKSFHGHYEEPPNEHYLIHEWLYTGEDIPQEEDNLRVHINVWLQGGNPPSDGQEVEIIINDCRLPPTQA